MRQFAILFFLLVTFSYAQAQIREIPPAVEETFTSQYPAATEVEYKDQLTRVQVFFTWEGSRMMATYNNKGHWKGSEKAWDYDALSEDIKLGYSKSKYAGDEWEVDETAIIYQPGGGSEQYRLRVKKNDLQKKYLYFNKKGRLLRESITL